jgi:hypothetical protein
MFLVVAPGRRVTPITRAPHDAARPGATRVPARRARDASMRAAHVDHLTTG